MNDCPFCATPNAYLERPLAFARFDTFPVSAGHTLIIPRRHVASFFDLATEEHVAMLQLLVAVKQSLDAQFGADGYNIGLNVGEAAGQTIWHAHLHVIPRYRGDVANPRGGVRGVIPALRDYP